MMIKKRDMKKIIFSLMILLVVMTACNDDFLDRYPKMSISEDNFFKTEDDLQMYIYGLHSVTSKWGRYISEGGTDNMTTTAALEIKTILTGSPSSENLTSGWSWGRLRSINFFLENYDNPEIEASVKKHYAGVARYYRAAFYYNMVKRYSDVPWYSHTLSSTDKDLYKARDPRALVVDSVMADLAYAVSAIREEVPVGAINRWAALMLQARIALHEGTYRRYHPELEMENTAERFLEIARDAALEIMNSGVFTIYNTGDPSQDYYTLFSSADLSTHPEVILVNQQDYDKQESTWGGTNINMAVFGDYEQCAAKDLLNAYLMNDGSRFTDQTGYDTMTFVTEFKDRDPRLYQTLVYPGWVMAPNDQPYIQRFNKNFTGYHQLKGYINSTDEKTIADVDVYVYRYAEALLVYAEAKAELNELTQADLDISVNVLRDRAGMPHMDMAQANADPDPLLEAKYPDVTGANAGVLLEIRRERRVELALEGYRFDDLMRWHAGKVLENAPAGMYFPSLGKFDMTGDGIVDIYLMPKNRPIPPDEDKEENELGIKLVYYKAGNFGDDVTIYLANGTSGNIVTEDVARSFLEPRDYYRPIPLHETMLNPNLVQIFGWQ
jgi:hypothetical protein